MKNSLLLKKAEEYVTAEFNEKIPNEYVYHNIEHIKRVVRDTEEIGEKENLSENDMETALLAAWLHDIGYINRYDDNEYIGAENAAKFLKDQGCTDNKIEAVKKCIEATKMPQNPQTKIEKVVCDADLSNFGKKYFFETSELIRREMEFARKENISLLDWYKDSAELLKNHTFHTEYAKMEFDKRKNKNIKELEKRIKELDMSDNNQIKSEFSKKSKKKDPLQSAKPPNRGIETMFRNSLRGHLDLSGLADNKANIMLSINAIIISIVVSSLLPNLENNSKYIIPTIVLLSVCIVTIIFATLSTRPKVTEGIFTKEDIKQKRTNLLFFGNFHKMDYDEFEWGMKEMMKSREFLYSSMIRDFYDLGRVLHRKYRFLRICYTVFMYGLVLSVITFIIFLAAGS